MTREDALTMILTAIANAKETIGDTWQSGVKAADLAASTFGFPTSQQARPIDMLLRMGGPPRDMWELGGLAIGAHTPLGANPGLAAVTKAAATPADIDEFLGNFVIRKDKYGSLPWHIYRKDDPEYAIELPKGAPKSYSADPRIPSYQPMVANFKTRKAALELLREEYARNLTK
jgi:hypothetical protein